MESTANELFERGVRERPAELASGDLPGRRARAVAREAVVMPHSMSGPLIVRTFHGFGRQTGFLTHHLSKDGVQSLAHLGIAREHLDFSRFEDLDGDPPDVFHAITDAVFLMPQAMPALG